MSPPTECVKLQSVLDQSVQTYVFLTLELLAIDVNKCISLQSEAPTLARARHHYGSRGASESRCFIRATRAYVDIHSQGIALCR